MKDLTQGSIVRNILAMAAPMAAGMIFQTLYFLVDLYFVAGIGDAAVAGVGAAGTQTFTLTVNEAPVLLTTVSVSRAALTVAV